MWQTEDESVMWIDRDEFPLMRDATAQVRMWLSDMGMDWSKPGRGRAEKGFMDDEHEPGYHDYDDEGHVRERQPCEILRRVWRYEPYE